MTYNTYGRLFRVTSWGESHGPAIGCIVDGCPPNLPLEARDIQPYLDQRRPGKSPFVSPRQEPDQVKILSGTYQEKEGAPFVTTGTPISLLIENTNQRSKDYHSLQDVFRPGHADFSYYQKYGVRDPRGGGRSSARETAMRVAAGAIARKALGDCIKIRAAVIQIGALAVDQNRWSWEECHKNAFFCPDAEMASQWENYLKKIRQQQTSVGALVEVIAEGVPAGWGAPVYGKLDADLAAGLMSINAAKGVEIGSGFASVSQTGEQASDEMCSTEYWQTLQKSQTMSKTSGKNETSDHQNPDQETTQSRFSNLAGVKFLRNHNGGVLGGISTGQTIRARIAFKPTSSIPTERHTVDREGKDTVLSVKGRHDPCVGLRAPPIAEAMMACILLDQKLLHWAQNGEQLKSPV